MFTNNDEQDDFFAEGNSDFSQQDNSDSADFFSTEEDCQPDTIPNVQSPEQHSSFGYKTVGIVVALALVVLAFVVLGISNIKLVKKTSSTGSQSQVQQTIAEPQATQVTKTEATESETTNSQVYQSNNSSTSDLISIPDSTYMDYSSKVVLSQGVVQDLSKFLQNGQVIYCINIDISIGTTSTSVKYYCGYNVFNQVKVGDILTVEYQQVSKSCFSVCTITK